MVKAHPGCATGRCRSGSCGTPGYCPHGQITKDQVPRQYGDQHQIQQSIVFDPLPQLCAAQLSFQCLFSHCDPALSLFSQLQYTCPAAELVWTKPNTLPCLFFILSTIYVQNLYFSCIYGEFLGGAPAFSIFPASVLCYTFYQSERGAHEKNLSAIHPQAVQTGAVLPAHPYSGARGDLLRLHLPAHDQSAAAYAQGHLQAASSPRFSTSCAGPTLFL